MIRRIQLTLLMLLIGVWAMASDTSVKNADGVEIWYDFNSNTKTASVTYRGSYYSAYSNEYTGEVIIPSKVTYEGMEYSVAEIGGDAFYDCSGLTSVTIPEGVTSIGGSAFEDCSGLTSVTIPESVTSIGDCAFYDCSGLTSVTIPEGVTEIGGWVFSGTAFYNNESNWENNVLYIDNCLIDVKTELSGEYVIKEDTRLITSLAFYNCSGLTSVTIPEGVTEIGDDAFYKCSGLANIEVSSDNVAYTTVDGVLFSKDKTELVCYPAGKSATSYIIPEGVTSIGYDAFAYCSSLTSVTIPESVAEIGEGAFDHSGLISVTIHKGVMSIGRYAFTDCSALTSVTIPESMTEIVKGLFCDCSSLTNVTIPESVTEIGGYAFAYCSALTSVTIPKSVMSIGGYAFYDCSALTSITSKSTTPPTVEDDAYTFKEVDKSIPLYVPAESVGAYKSAEGWKEFTNILPIQADGNPISEVKADNISVRSIGNTIVVTGTDNYTVYSISGQSLGKVTNVERGIYIVVAEGKSYKVAIK